MKTYTTIYIRKFLEDFLQFCDKYHYYVYIAHNTHDRHHSYEDGFYIHKIPKDLYTTRARVLSKLVLMDTHNYIFDYICKIRGGDFKNIESEYMIKCDRYNAFLTYIKGCLFPLYFPPIYYIMTFYRSALFRKDGEVIDKLFSWYRDSILDYLNTGVFEKTIDEMVEFYTAEEENGELVAWLLEFKKEHFGFDGSRELLVL